MVLAGLVIAVPAGSLKNRNVKSDSQNPSRPKLPYRIMHTLSIGAGTMGENL
jgi:hypothetical protein